MNIQSEAQLESGLVKRLHSLGWEPVTITDGAGLRANLKAQLRWSSSWQVTTS